MQKNRRNEDTAMASYRYERDIKPEDLIQETPPPLTPAQQRANWWHYHWYYVVLIAAALLAVGDFVWNRVTAGQPDYTVAVVSRTDPDTAFLSQLETQLEALAGDVNGDGKVKVTVKGIWLALDFETQDAALQRLMQSSEDKLNSDFYLCESALFIVDDPTAMEQSTRRREKQVRYNMEHEMLPRQAQKSGSGQSALLAGRVDTSEVNMTAYPIAEDHYAAAADVQKSYTASENIDALIDKAREEMERAAKSLDFLAAAKFRDRMYELQKLREENRNQNSEFTIHNS